MRGKKIVRVTRDQLSPLAAGVAARLDVLAEAELPLTGATIRYQIKLCASTMRVADSAKSGVDKLNAFELVARTLTECLRLAYVEFGRPVLAKDVQLTWGRFAQVVRSAQRAAEDLRDIELLVNTAEASEREVHDGTQDEHLPEPVKYNWSQAVQCLARLTVYIDAA